jgi:nicotinate-nucleotide adenylyltransferase
MSKVGIFGGSFNPIHVGHIKIAEQACEELGLDRLIFVPAARPPHKNSLEISFEDRVAMVRRAVAHNPRFEVTEIENKREGPSYTVDTLEAIKFVNPDSDLYLLIGADTLWELGTWRDVDGILARATLAIAKRPGSTSNIQERQPDGITDEQWEILKKAPVLKTRWEISSTSIRRLVSGGRSISGLVPDAVVKHMQGV